MVRYIKMMSWIAKKEAVNEKGEVVLEDVTETTTDALKTILSITTDPKEQLGDWEERKRYNTIHKAFDRAKVSRKSDEYPEGFLILENEEYEYIEKLIKKPNSQPKQWGFNYGLHDALEEFMEAEKITVEEANRIGRQIRKKAHEKKDDDSKALGVYGEAEKTKELKDKITENVVE